MWIIPRNLPTSHSVQGTEESTSDSIERLAELFAQSLMWRSKPSSSKTWSQRLKTDTSTQRLSTRILNASRGDAFADEWTSSVEASLVSHLVQRGDEPETKILDTSSPTSSTVCESWGDLPLFSWRTSKGSLALNSRATDGQTPKGRPFCSMSSESWSAWVTTRRREYSQRVKSARPINESAYLSWRVAPISESQGGLLFQGCLSEGGGGEQWKTPVTSEHRVVGDYDYHLRMSQRSRKSWKLTSQAVLATPRQEAQSNTHGNRPASPAKLNPRWVETLMGLPVGWVMPSCVDPWTTEPMSSGCSETESSPTQQREPSASCGAISSSEDDA